MICFVDLRGQVAGYRFAFWDTDCEQFCVFRGNEAWACAEDFVLDYCRSSSGYGDPPKPGYLNDFEELLPGWTGRVPGQGSWPIALSGKSLWSRLQKVFWGLPPKRW